MIITIDKMEYFQAISYDVNPIHIDERYAKNTLLNGRTVYGILGVLEMLEHYFKQYDIDSLQSIKKIDCMFNKNLALDTKYDIVIDKQNIKIKGGDVVYTNIDLCIVPMNTERDITKFILDKFDENVVKDVSFENITGGKYSLISNPDIHNIDKYYKLLSKFIDKNQLLLLINLSRIVGMENPGKYAIFYGFNFETINNYETNILTLDVNSKDEFSKIIEYDIKSEGIVGNLKALYRPIDVEQIKMQNINIKQTFTNEHILIIGGSRGLGEVILKIFLRGGAKVTSTYCNNKPEHILKEAEQLKLSKNLSIIQYDVLNVNNGPVFNEEYTKVFYFATPKIIHGNFNNELFKKYQDCYIYGIYNILSNISFNKLNYIYYPSTTVNIQKSPSYAIAKQLSEIYLKNITNIFPRLKNIKIDIHNLPALLTDQTNNILNDSEDPYEFYIQYFNIEKQSKQKIITVISNTNYDFIKKNLIKGNDTYLNCAYEFNFVDYENYFGDFLHNTKTAQSESVFIINRLEDILCTDIVDSYNKDNISIIEEYLLRLKQLRNTVNGSVYTNYIYKSLSSPFNFTHLDTSKLVDYYNTKIQEIDNIQLFDLNVDMQKFDLDEFILGKYGFSYNFSNYISNVIIGFILNNVGKSVKCIITDLDNTMWGGVLTEDGIGNVEIGKDYPGYKFLLYQKLLKMFKERGVILAICSKNDDKIVKQMFDVRNENILKLNDFICTYTNYEEKSKNIRKICSELDISPEHVLFVDDSVHERNEVRFSLPQCKILEFDVDSDSDQIYKLLYNPYLITNTLTTDDLKKHESYETRKNIKKEETSFDNKDDFIKSLNINLSFQNINDGNKNRAVQIINKTNQFNLTHIRMNREEFEEFSSNKNNKCIMIVYKDKFTTIDNVGLILLEINESIYVKNINLSCRVLKRGVENGIFYFLKNMANQLQKTIVGQINYIEKNQIIHNIYSEHGFVKINDQFVYDNINDNIIKPDLFTLSYSEPDEENTLSNEAKSERTDGEENALSNEEKSERTDSEENALSNEAKNRDKQFDSVIITKLKEIIKHEFNISNDICNFTEIQGYDSMGFIKLISRIKNEFKTQINYQKIISENNIDRFCCILSETSLNNKPNININSTINSNIYTNKLSFFDGCDKDKIKIKEIIIQNTNKNNPYGSDIYFDWLFSGCYSDIPSILINKKNDIIDGICGCIPLKMQYFKDNKMQIQNTYELMVWFSQNNCANEMIDFLKKKVNIIVASNSTRPAIEVYKFNDFTVTNKFNTYIIPLNKEYLNMLIDTNNTSEEFDQWFSKIKFNETCDFYEKYDINNIDSQKLEDLWIKFSNEYKILSLYRCNKYWSWRYINNPYYNYKYFGSFENLGIIIYREENIKNSENKGIRILDIIPLNNSVLNTLINYFVNFCFNKKHIVIDFMCTNNIYNDELTSIGFKKQDDNFEKGITSLPIYFEFISDKVKPRNFSIYIEDDYDQTCIPYFTKGLSDMDQPRCDTCKNAFCAGH